MQEPNRTYSKFFIYFLADLHLAIKGQYRKQKYQYNACICRLTDTIVILKISIYICFACILDISAEHEVKYLSCFLVKFLSDCAFKRCIIATGTFPISIFFSLSPSLKGPKTMPPFLIICQIFQVLTSSYLHSPACTHISPVRIYHI